MKDSRIYEKCPVYASDRFLLRLVQEGDAEDLLQCYSDESVVRLMNADNCTSNFHYRTLDEMNDCIQDWLGSYERGVYIRFSIVDTQSSKAVGTIEMFDKNKSLGILRLDLCSSYEKQESILELIRLSVVNFYDVFGVKQIAIKAIPAAEERVSALRAYGFVPAERSINGPHGDYYIHNRCL